MRLVAVLALVSAGASAAHAGKIFLPTNVGLGADAEVRESFPTQNRGDSTEIATRVADRYDLGDPSDGNDRNSVIYLQFDLGAIAKQDFTTAGSTLRLTFRNNNLNDTRIHDTDGLAPDHGLNGFRYYGIPGASFNEATITYLNAPGISFDGDVGTTDFNGGATLLGERDLPAIGTQSHLPIGMQFDFQSMALDAFLATEAMNNPSGVAVIAIVRRNLGLVATSDPPKTGDEPALWTNFNYLFNPKEQVTLNSDANYDSDINDPNNPLGGPWGGSDNSNGEFSPQLVLVPAPASALILTAAAFVGLRRRR